MESALYGIYALVIFVSEILLVRCAHSFDFLYVNISYVNTVRQHFPWSILYVLIPLEVKFHSKLPSSGASINVLEIQVLIYLIFFLLFFLLFFFLSIYFL